MKTKLTVIVDNTAACGMAGEWGLSILAEFGEKKILVDAGASELFAENLKKLGFDIADIDYATLSHAHFDHANGMPRFFKDNTKAKFFLRDSTAENCYEKFFIFSKYIGIPKNVLRDFRDRIEIVKDDYLLTEGAWLIPHKQGDLSSIGRREHMYLKTAAGWKPDNFSHEQSLVLDTDRGLVIINCCSHGGVVNIVKEISETFPGKKIYGVIGGFHLYNKSADEVRAVARSLKETGIEFVCTGHCTMDKAFKLMKEELGDMIVQFYTGLELNC